MQQTPSKHISYEVEFALHKEQSMRGRLLLLFTLFSLAIIGFVPYVFLSVIESNRLADKAHDISQAASAIRYHDEVLTSTARLYAFQPSPELLNKYNKHAATLDKVLLNAQALSPLIKDAIWAVAASNEKLIALETQAIELVQSGRRESAAAVLFSDEYQQLKMQYSSSLVKALNNARDITNQSMVYEQERRVDSLLAAFSILSLLFVFTLFYGFKHFKQSDHSVNKLLASLKQNIDEIEAANRAKSQFLANMSHEIRTPLNGILGNLQLLEEQNLSGDMRKHVDTAKSSTYVLSTIVNDILDFSKVEANAMELETVGFNLEKSLTEVSELIKAECERKNLELTLDCQMQSPWRLGDPVRLRQVVLNLLSNSVKFTHQGHIRLKLKESAASDELTIVVADSGIGMSSQAIDKVFHRFTQADNSTTRIYGGTGLGMSIVQSLVDLMQGQVKISSVKGQGTEVTITLTLPRTSSAEAEALVVEDVYLEGKKLLVADDNDINRTLLKAMLEPTKCIIQMAEDGLEAVSYADESYTAVLMDIHMPNLDGIEACKRIKAQYPNLPIIAVTASVLKDELKAYEDAGFDAVIGKPVLKPKLLEAIARSSWSR